MAVGRWVLAAAFVAVAACVLVAVGVTVAVAVRVKVGGMGVKVWFPPTARGNDVAAAVGNSSVMRTGLGDSGVEAGCGADDGAHETKTMMASMNNRFMASTDDQHVGVFYDPAPAALPGRQTQANPGQDEQLVEQAERGELLLEFVVVRSVSHVCDLPGASAVVPVLL